MDLRRPAGTPSRFRAPPKAQAGPRLELTVDSLAFGGEGVARHEGLVVLVDGGLPGDRVVARVVHRSRNFARARVETVLSPSPHRIPARCAHFPECGGCSYQHLDYSAQLAAKRGQVVDLLERIGRFSAPSVAPALGAARPFLYRNRMTYAFASREGSAPGLHRRGDPLGVVEVPGCLLPESTLQQAYLRLRDDLRSLPPGRRPSQIAIQAGESGEFPVGMLRGPGDPPADILRLAVAWTADAGPLRGVVWVGESGERQRDRGSVPRFLSGEGHVHRRLGAYRYRLPAGSFFQANTEVAATLFEEVARRCSIGSGDILELYSGVGALTLFLGGTGMRVLAVEGDATAVRAAEVNARENRVETVEFRTEGVQEAVSRLGASGRKFGTVVVDPPRSGLPPATAGILCKLALQRILYISCNPSTLARDLKAMAESGEWRLQEVVPVDLFPQTAEIECLAELLPVPQERRS